jgi:hypothetical protein
MGAGMMILPARSTFVVNPPMLPIIALMAEKEKMAETEDCPELTWA